MSHIPDRHSTNMRTKVMERNRSSYVKALQDARKKFKICGLTPSPSYVCNGLFCCKICDKYFEDHIITISGKGVITVVSTELEPCDLFIKKLNGKKVPWACQISLDIDWPTKETLNYRNKLPPSTSNHRKIEFGLDPYDDMSIASDTSEPQPLQSTKKKTIKSVK
mmetsp:Transcript_32943/g.47609  ORF Transcript_32943/g.47609 Transcript_32943/m.47609 type:complete len:165 (-) Transcript_32943:364-858(-)